MQRNSAGHDKNLRWLPLPWLILQRVCFLGEVYTREAARGLPWLHCLPLAAICQTTDAPNDAGALLSLAAARFCNKVDDNRK